VGVRRGRQNKILQYELKTGDMLYAWGTFGSEPGECGVSTDSASTPRATSTSASRTRGDPRSSVPGKWDRSRMIGPDDMRCRAGDDALVVLWLRKTIMSRPR